MTITTAINQETKSKSIAFWLFFNAAMVFCMIVIGAITRLTESGLSMVEWRPLIGALPPLSETEWQRVFDLYRETPEFQKKNAWMSLNDFKTIFFWEWFHRLWGRLIGLVYALPLAWFWLKGMIPKGYHWKLFALFILGGLQGVMGWYMVASGLVDEPAVSHYRLAAHLSLAFLLFALLIWMGLSLWPSQKPKRQNTNALYLHTWVVIGFFILTVFWGAYTAGLDAGLVYNETFPKMGDVWIPKSTWQYEPAWINFFETHAGVQFTHRWLAMLTVVMVLGLWAHAILKNIHLPAIYGLAVMAFLQMGLGIATLLSQVWLPVAVLHQAGAAILLMLLVMSLYQLKPRAGQPLGSSD